MTLLETQQTFAALVPRLIDRARMLGYEVTLAEAYRTPEQAAWNAAKGSGIAHSLHTKRLAIDLLLFKGEVWLQQSEDYRPLGEWWEQQHPLARWGGRFTKPDGNHFSLTYGNVA